MLEKLNLRAGEKATISATIQAHTKTGTKLTGNTASITATPFQKPYEKLYMVGDASPSGWNIETPETFTRIEAILIYLRRRLRPGRFKILKDGTGDWCGLWARPLKDRPSINSTKFILRRGCDADWQWQVFSTWKIHDNDQPPEARNHHKESNLKPPQTSSR